MHIVDRGLVFDRIASIKNIQLAHEKVYRTLCTFIDGPSPVKFKPLRMFASVERRVSLSIQWSWHT